MNRAGLRYWDKLAAGWSGTVPPPLAPNAEDLAWFQRRMAPRALLLGVTPSIAALPWPRGASLVAMDWSESMLRNVWPKEHRADHAAAVRGDWREIPLATASRDLALGDGCYTALGDRESARLMSAELHRVLSPGGWLCVRTFVRPEQPLSIDAMFRELASGERVSLTPFRWRLAIAVQGSRWGIALGDVWRVWNEHVPDPAVLARRHGWAEHELKRLEGWKGEQARYAFPSVAELRELLAPWFELVEADRPAYALGELFPRTAWRRRS